MSKQLSDKLFEAYKTYCKKYGYKLNDTENLSRYCQVAKVLYE